MANIEELIQITGNGLDIKDFNEIRAALIQRYKEVYGSDIDLSTATADGIFVNDIALLINNILQTMGILYSNLDVDYATGEYLDTLCKLSNITRKPATHSNVSLLVTNVGGSALNDLVDLQFVDAAGNIWTHTGTESFSVNETKELYVVCDDEGPIEAPAGWIKNTLTTSTLSVLQNVDANIGENIESDVSLRSRRIQSNGANGLTVLESLTGALLNISGIRDVLIYNNGSDANITAADGTNVDAHSIYIIIRKDAGIEIADSTIGNIIHGKLTPGIHTCDSTSSATYGTAKSYEYIVSAYGIQIAESSQYIYWKEAIPTHTQMSISLNPFSYFTTSEFSFIADSLITYLNGLSISTVISANDMLIETINADPKFKGNATYTVGTITPTGTTNYDTYYNYTTYSYKINTGTVGSNTVTNGNVTISGTAYTMVQDGVQLSADPSVVYPIVNGKVDIAGTEYIVTASQYVLYLN